MTDDRLLTVARRPEDIARAGWRVGLRKPTSEPETRMVDMGTLIGTIRRFGLVGPAYEVLGVADPSPAGEPQMRVHVFESDEVIHYPVSAILNDPADD